jgi:fructoselysine 6-kinase
VSANPTTGVAVVGDACVDVYLDTAIALSAVGGNALNVSVNLTLQGIRSELFAVLGDDRHGERIRAALRNLGVGVGGVQDLPGPSWVSYIARDHRGTAALRSEEPGVAGPYAPSAEEIAAFARFEHVHLVNLADPIRTLEQLAEHGVSTSYDFGRTGCVRAPVDIAFFSRPESASDEAEGLARAAVKGGAGLAIVTLGARGSLAVGRGRVLTTMPASPIAPVDTLGAGDCFIATFLGARLAEATVEAALADAHRLAARTCRHWGAWPQQPVSVQLGLPV